MTRSQGINYSTISTAQSCLQKYKLQYIDRLSTPGLESAELHWGTAMHTGIQAMFEEEDYVGVFSAYWSTVQNPNVKFNRYSWEDYQAMGVRLLERFKRLHFKYFTQHQSIEQRLYGTLGPHKIEGTPDYAGLYKGIRSVVDFKTSAQPYTKEKLITNEQMPLYSYLLEQQDGFKVDQLVYYVFCKSEERIQVLILPLTKSFLKDKIDNIRLMCEDLTSRSSFPKNPGSCMMGSFKCPYFETCYGKDE